MPLKDEVINYERIGKAQLIYDVLGYKNIETPWLATPQAIRTTLPINKKMQETVNGVLVGSGEQGFIQQMISGDLVPGRFQTTTPCFRDEEVYNEMTRLYFMKVELIWYMPEDPRAAFEKVINDALACFFKIGEPDTYDALRTDDGVDLMYNGIELGSYGIRQMNEHLWVYGTGLAEPRFTLALRSAAPPISVSVQEEHSHSHEETSAFVPTATPDTLPNPATFDSVG